ncbi:MAG: sulfatase-like hydrolase/transferase, partial [Verrucomicrobiota bacterium]
MTRNQITPDGAAFRATRIRTQPQTEFLRSRDEWFRPVNLRTGPDGALYVCDMYRRFIDHSRFFPDEFSQAHYMRAGFDQGRIWRITPASSSHQKREKKNDVDRAKRVYQMDLPSLVSEFRNASPEVIENAILAAQTNFRSLPELPSEFIRLTTHDNARVRYLALIAIGDSPERKVTEALKSAAGRDFADPWIRKAILSGAETRAGEILESVIKQKGFSAAPSISKLAFVREFSAAIGRRANAEETQRVAETVRSLSSEATWLRLAAYEGLGRAAKLTVAELSENAELALDSTSNITDRLAAIPLLKLLPADLGIEIWTQLLSSTQPVEVREAALEVASQLNRSRVSESFFRMWPTLDAQSKSKAMTLLAKSPLPLLKKMKAGEISPALLDPMSRWVYLRSSNTEIKTLAEELFARPSDDRAAILTNYLSAESRKGDATHGQQLFLTNCAVCHQFRGEGGQIGPDISDVRNKPWQALLSDILDPNRMVEARWTAHTMERKRGPSLLGLVTAETADSVTIKGLGVNQTVPRSEIVSVRDMGQSLMPVGFEGSLDHQAMADLIAYLQGRTESPKRAKEDPAEDSPPSAEKPNIILILCDNLGYGDIEPFWPETPHRTPNLTRMAAEGMKLSHFYVSAGVCTPSRASIMTGCYAQRVGLHRMEVDNHVLRPVSPLGLHPDEITMAEVLKKAGYATSLLGKWHLGDQPDFLPTNQGFDSYFGIPYSDDMTAREWNSRVWPPLPLLENETVIEAPVDRNNLTKRYTERALAFIRENQKDPFFLFLSHAMPGSTKTPYSSERFQGQSENGPWGDSVEEIDWSTGEILNELSDLGIAEKTLVIWTSDNGAPNNPGDIRRGTNQPLSGRGYTTSEGGMRVPTIAWWPGKIRPGSESRELATTMDFLPTFAQLAGQRIEPTRKIDGKDIGNLLWGSEPDAKSPHEAFFYYQLDQLQAVRS